MTDKWCEYCGKFKLTKYKKKYCSTDCAEASLIVKRNLNRQLRLKNDINFKLRCNLSVRIVDLLKGKKNRHTEELLGCSIDFLKTYLEDKFTIGMSFNNYGAWHIDHIKPCSKFDLTKDAEQRKCFHYTNLQPLWATENLSKGSK